LITGTLATNHATPAGSLSTPTAQLTGIGVAPPSAGGKKKRCKKKKRGAAAAKRCRKKR